MIYHRNKIPWKKYLGKLKNQLSKTKVFYFRYIEELFQQQPLLIISLLVIIVSEDYSKYLADVCRGVFITQSNLYDGAFLRKS